MRFLRQNTAARIPLGPVLSSADGLTPKTVLDVTTIKLTFVQQGNAGAAPVLVLDTNPTASGGNNDAIHVAGDDAGMWDQELTAANLATLGFGRVLWTDVANIATVWEDVTVIPAVVYDALFLGTGRLDANVTHVAGTAQTAGDLSAQLTTVAGLVDTEVLPTSIRAAVGLSIPDLDSQLSSLDDKIAEVNNLIGTNGASLSELPWNAAWDAEVQSEVTDALAAYDPPTFAEMVAAFSAGDDAVIAAIGALNDLSSVGAQAAAAAALTAYGAATGSAVTGVPAAVIAAATATPIAADVKKINNRTIDGTGVLNDEFEPV